MSEESCENCRFSKKHYRNDQGDVYQCRFNSPVLIYDGIQLVSTFPWFKSPVWCGSYEPGVSVAVNAD